MSYIFTSESVSEGHPDKICDQISDAILDECLKGDKESRVACETLIKNNTVIVAGEITTDANVQYENIARSVVKKIGYENPELGFSYDTFQFQNLISDQSSDINEGISHETEIGSGDQGLMFGYACKETKELMPLPISLAHKLMIRHSELRKSNNIGLRPDGKSQVSVEYDDNYRPKRIDSIVLSTQHDPDLDMQTLRQIVQADIIDHCIPNELLDENTKYLINPAGRFVIGGPVGDCGLTGRKIIVDSYGGMARHGGGGFSGKDPTKVDRSAAYALRQVAKSLVKNDLCDYCEVQASYAIGISKPVSLFINTFESEKVSLKEIYSIVKNNFDLTPSGIIRDLELLEPIYFKTASFGHFGRENMKFKWEEEKKL